MPIDEIVVTGQRDQRPPNRPPPQLPVYTRGDTGGGGGGGGGPGGQPSDRGFVAPPVVPIIDEIITTATRQSSTSFWSMGARAGFTGSLGWAGLGGWFISAVIDQLGQNRLENAYWDFQLGEIRTLPDTPVETMPPEVIPEIVVLGQMLDPAMLLRYAPVPPPLITPDWDPSIMVPFVPRTLPTPAAVPDTVVAPPPMPLPTEIPTTIPLRVPLPTVSPVGLPMVQPDTRPGTRPGTLPGVMPLVDPLPQTETPPLVQPFVQPATLPGLRAVPRTSGLTRVGTRSVSLPRPLLEEAQLNAAGVDRCPPCTKEKEKRKKPRSQCFKKLVKESLWEDDDSEYRWTEIDCLTGREL